MNMKLLYGTHRHIKPEFTVYNFSGLVEGFPDAGILPRGLDPNIVAGFEEREFDMWYANQLLNEHTMFMNMIHLIYTLQQANTLYLIIGDDWWSYTLIESFLKFLQARYGITGTLVQSDEDIEFAGETDFNPHYGIRNYDIDYMKYSEEWEYIRIMQGGTPYVE